MKRLTRGFLAGTVSLVALVGTSLPAVAATKTVASGPSYYLALGDSLSQGYQPNANGIGIDTDQGYVDDIFSAALANNPSLQVVKLGCPGETTKTFLYGGICPTYASQMSAATRFLRKYGAKTSFVTIDIGANNVDNCVVNGVPNLNCVTKGITQMERNLPKILAELEAADPGVRIYAMNYYDPFLAAYLQGAAGQALAAESIGLTNAFNNDEDSIYSAAGVQVADVQDSPFLTTDTTFNNGDQLGGQPVPDNVYEICTLTYMCVAPPQGPNIHANPAGYQGIADTFLGVINPLG